MSQTPTQEMQDKLSQVKAELVSSTTSPPPTDEQIQRTLEESDGNVQHALKVLREPTTVTNDDEPAAASTVAGTLPTATAAAAQPPSTATTDAASVPPPSSTPPPHVDPLAAELRSMFPTISLSVINMIVESHTAPAPGGVDPASGRPLSEDERLDRCIGDLLMMSDPEFKPEPSSGADANQAAHISMDEQFARSLAMQDRESSRPPIPPISEPQGQNQFGGLPYQPRVRKTPVARYEAATESYQDDVTYRPGGGRGGQQDTPPPHGGVGEQFEEKFERFAEAGKKTFDTFFTKAKTKFNEFQESQAQRQQQQHQQQGQPGQGGPIVGATGPSTGAPAGGIAGTLGGLWSGAQAAVKEATAGFSGTGAGGHGHAQTSGQGSASGWNQSRGGGVAYGSDGWPQPAAKQETKRWQPTDAYDDEPTSQRADVYQPPSSSSSSFSIPSPPKTQATLPPIKAAQPYDMADGSTQSLTTGAASGDKSGSSLGSGKIDTSKLGMLPKKKVSLLSSSPSNGGLTGGGTSSNASSTLAAIPSPSSKPAARGTGKPEDDAVEEEYTRNPFDE